MSTLSSKEKKEVFKWYASSFLVITVGVTVYVNIILIKLSLVIGNIVYLVILDALIVLMLILLIDALKDYPI